MVGKVLQHSGDKLKIEKSLRDRKGDIRDKVYCKKIVSLDYTNPFLHLCACA